MRLWLHICLLHFHQFKCIFSYHFFLYSKSLPLFISVFLPHTPSPPLSFFHDLWYNALKHDCERCYINTSPWSLAISRKKRISLGKQSSWLGRCVKNAYCNVKKTDSPASWGTRSSVTCGSTKLWTCRFTLIISQQSKLSLQRTLWYCSILLLVFELGLRSLHWTAVYSVQCLQSFSVISPEEW